MFRKLTITPPGRLSDELLLRTIGADPASGTILGPIQQSVLDRPSFEGQPIINGPTASYFHLISGNFLKRVKDNVPILGQEKEEDWMIEPDVPTANADQVSLISRTYQFLNMDLRDPTVPQYTVGFKSSKGAIYQTIGIDTRNFEVTTNFYSIQIPCTLVFTKLFDLAISLSTAIYYSGTYEEAHLGKLQFSQHNFTTPLTLKAETKTIERPPIEPDEKTPFTITSTASAFKALWSSYHQPVVEIEASPKNDFQEWTLNLTLYRSPQSSNRLMPLRNGLLGLWKKIEENISRNGISSPIKKS